MRNDLEALIWEFRAAVALHRVGDARTALQQALHLSRTHDVDAGTRFSLLVDAATLSQFTGDLPAARRYAVQAGRIGLDDELHRFWSGFIDLRQAGLLGRFDAAAGHMHAVLEVARSSRVGPARQPAALAELAWLQSRLGRFDQAIGLSETACERLVRLGSHPEWAADFLFDLARMQLQAARAIDEKDWGHIDGSTPSAAGPGVGPGASRRLRARASQALELALSLQAPGWDDSLLARSVLALRAVTAEQPAAASPALADHLGALVRDYAANRMLEGLIFSSGELARLHLERRDPDAALRVLAGARGQMPGAGFDPLREQLDYLESLAQRLRGDHRAALIAYQRYAQRAALRRAGVPTALRDGSLDSGVKRLAAGPERLHHLPPRIQPLALSAAAATEDVAVELDALTGRERDIVRLVCEGLTNQQIAERLGVSPFTVRNHLLAVFRKFGVHSRRTLAAIVQGGQPRLRAAIAAPSPILAIRPASTPAPTSSPEPRHA